MANQKKHFNIQPGHESMNILPTDIEKELLSAKNILGPDYFIVRASSNTKSSEEIDALVTTVSSKSPSSLCSKYEPARLLFISKGYSSEEFKILVDKHVKTGLPIEQVVDNIVQHVSTLPIRKPQEITKASNYLTLISEDKTEAKKFDIIVNKIIKQQIKEHTEKFGEIGKDHKVAYVLGSAAAGKSTTIKSIRDTMNAFPADQDKLKSDIATTLGIDINDPSMQKLAKIAMEKLITYLRSSGYNYIHEKVGDEPHKMLKLFKESVDSGYEMQLHCVHASNSVCRVRNQNRCIGLINSGEPARIVPDEIVQDMGDKALTTYLFVMKNYGEYFTEGHCYCSDTSTDPSVKRLPQELITLQHGQFVNEKTREQYIQAGNATYNSAFQKIKQKLIINLQQSNPSIVSLINSFEPNGRLFETSPLRELQTLFESEVEKTLIQIFAPHKNYRGSDSYNLQEIEKQIEQELKNFDFHAIEKSITIEIEKSKQQEQEQQSINKNKPAPEQSTELNETTKQLD